MSLWKIGAQDVTEEAQAIKDRISSKESHIAAQETKLMRQAAKLDELQTALNEALHKLSQESERAIRLEDDLKQSSEDLRREKIASQNIEATLVAAQEKVKVKECEARELETIIQNLSHSSDATTLQRTKLEKEKAMLEARLRELEANYRELSQSPAAITPSRLPRRRSSSMSNTRIPALEQELQLLRSSLTQKERELEDATQKLSRAQEGLIKCENEKIASEKRASAQIRDLQTLLEAKEDEIKYMQGQLGDGSREAELMARIDEDEAKIAELEKLVGDASMADELKEKLKKAETKLREQARESEMRHIELVAEKEAALDRLDVAQSEVQKLCENVAERDARIKELGDQRAALRQQLDFATPVTDDDTAAHVERLLGAIDRLRGERDDLKRDLEYVQAESRYTIEALEAKLSASSAPSVQDDSQSKRTIQEQRLEIRRLGKTSASLAVVIRCLQNQIESNATSLAGLHEQLRNKDTIVLDLESRLVSSLQSCETVNAQRDALLGQSERQTAEWTETFEKLSASSGSSQAQLEEAQSRLARVIKSLEEVESERDALKLQVTNLTSDLMIAQEELAEAENRYTNLQRHQLDAMTANEATRALREQLHELEARVLRRTEQIGLHQHDIKRLETNLELQEQRLVEMTSEMETLAAQKEAMVEDCATAREARDEALRQIERLEIEVEVLEGQRDEANGAIENLVAVIADVISRSRTTVRSFEARAQQDNNHFLTQLTHRDAELQQLASLHRCTVERLREETASLQELQQSASASNEGVRSLALALAISRSEGVRVAGAVTQLRRIRSHLVHEVSSLQGQCNSYLSDNQALTAQLEASKSRSAAEQADYLEKLRALESSLAATSKNHQASIEELRRQKVDLEQRLADAELAKSATAASELSELNARYKELHIRFEETQIALSKAEEDLKASRTALEDAISRNEACERQLEDATKRLEEDQTSRVELEQLNNEQASKIQGLEGRLAEAMLQAGQHQEDMQALRLQTQSHIEQVRKDLTQRLEDERNISSTLQSELEDQAKQLDECSGTIEELETRLQQKIEVHDLEQLALKEALTQATTRKEEVESLLADAQDQLQTIKSELDSANTALEALRSEKEAFLTEITTLEAEAQKSLSLHRYMESQAKESERTISSLTDTVENLRTDLARAEKLAQTSEMNLSLQSSQHKREMSELQRQLVVLQSKPSLDSLIQELKERNNEMEELLRAKCTEIEENDDRVLEMLKDNKKLGSKVEALTRKVQNLQTKLAATKATNPSAKPILTPISPVQIDLASSTRRSRSVTAPPVPPVPPISSHAAAPLQAQALHSTRVVSGPSSLPRPKTPERHSITTPVFKARTPERPQPPVAAELPSTSAGKKRRAPDDFDLCENVPPQVFTADSLPSEDAESRTPHVRRVLQTLHSGFTPIRHQFASRSNVSLSSPKRSVTMHDKSPSKSPRLSSMAAKSSKRSWLGKIRGASSQASSRPVFDFADS